MPSGATGRMAGDRIAHLTLRAWVAASPSAALALIVVALATSWVATYLLGGAQNVVPHWYYVPILFAAVRFGPLAAVIVGVISGLLAGPATYLDVATATAQEPHRWLTRMGFFVLIGSGMASMARTSLPRILHEVRDRRQQATLGRALDNGELFVRYQPIVDLQTGRLHGVEALVRWQHPTRGELAPGRFLPSAERGPVIHRLGGFVLEQALQQAARWTELAVHAGQPAPRVAVNLSGRELESPTLVARVAQQLADAGVDPSLICLEVTESVLVDDLDLAVTRLTRLKALGVRLAVDDFGTGYSSLSAVHRYPIDVVKIDRSFLAAMEDDHDTQTMLGGMALFARSLDLTTVAEGVETHQQANLITELGYDLAQGYHYARPLTADAIDHLLTRPHQELGDPSTPPQTTQLIRTGFGRASGKPGAVQ